ncbi:hypothetical protein Tco_0274378, partial [Tanacetum coccineum]
MDYQCTQPSEIEICRQAEEKERQWEIKERNRVHEETMQMLREMIKIQEEKRIAKEKEAVELGAKLSTKRIPLSDFIPPVTPNVKTVNSLRMGDKHLDTQKGSLESSVKDPIPIP